jgi:hypothetical protein
MTEKQFIKECERFMANFNREMDDLAESFDKSYNKLEKHLRRFENSINQLGE